MFGILLGLIGCTVAGIEGMQRNIEDIQERSKARRNGNLTYLDSYGHEHLTSTGKCVITTTTNDSKDLVIRDLKGDTVYYNLSEIKRNSKPQKKKKLCRNSLPSMPRGYEVTYWEYVEHENDYTSIPRGVDYVKIFTPYNDNEMLEKFETDICNKNKINEWYRNMWNKHIYNNMYNDKWILYEKETGDYSIKKLEDFIKKNNYPTFDEFVKKYNL